MPPDAEDGQNGGQSEQQDAIENDFGQTGAGQRKQSAPAIRVIVGSEMIASDVAAEF